MLAVIREPVERGSEAEAQKLFGCYQALELFGKFPALDRMPEP
jgi:hypothetical protein